MKPTKKNISPESQAEAMKIAKATQKPAQTKEQTKIIAQGIEKGIALYKKQQKEKSRQADRARKKTQKTKQLEPQPSDTSEVGQTIEKSTQQSNSRLPWVLLAISWAGFITYISMS